MNAATREQADDPATSRGRALRAGLATVAVFLLVASVVVALLLSQFGTVRSGDRPLRTIDEPVGATTDGGLGESWQAIRGRWSTAPQGATVAEPDERISVAVRPVGGVDGTIEVTGPAEVEGWSVVYRWVDPGTYGLVVLEPDAGEISVVAVVSDRTRLLGTAALPSADAALRTVAVELAGPVARVRVDGELVVAGRDDDLDGTSAGVALIGAAPGARFDRFRSSPPEDTRSRTVTIGDR